MWFDGIILREFSLLQHLHLYTKFAEAFTNSISSSSEIRCQLGFSSPQPVHFTYKGSNYISLKFEYNTKTLKKIFYRQPID